MICRGVGEPAGQADRRKQVQRSTRAGRIKVLSDLTVPGHPNVFVIGEHGFGPWRSRHGLGRDPGAKYAARAISAELEGATPAVREPFHYFDKGSAPLGLARWARM